MFYISEYGIKIKNIEASTLFEYNNGVRDHYEYKDAMFTNSLFSDFLKEHGLKVWKEESTRDIICLEFNFGSRSYEDEIAHLNKIAKQARLEYKIAKHCIANYIDNYTVKNTLFDGQALIDSSIFPDWGNGYILLRHHFCKMAAFNTNIQLFFKDYFGENYYMLKLISYFLG